ncbi:hypothetical protein Slin14017_G090270 [Septoria linicola]|nr:hypothetical protein Slin14017_G090270 [Septoria linicola]
MSRREHTSDPGDLLCAAAWSVLCDFRSVAGLNREWPAEDHSHLRLSLHPFASVLREVEPTVRLLADKLDSKFDSLEIEGFVIDIFTFGLILMSRFGLVPIWVVAQCQMLMDILDALGSQPGVGFQVLVATLTRGSEDARLEKYHRIAQVAPGHANFKRLKDYFAEQAKVTTCLLPQSFTGTYPWPRDRHPEELLSAFPLLAGSWLRDITLYSCKTGIEHANADICTLGAAYLYRAANRWGLLEGEWADMEALIHGQAMHGQYVLDSHNIEGYVRHLDIAIGIPVTAFSSRSSEPPKLPEASVMATRMKRLEVPSSFMLSVLESPTMVGAAGTPYACLLRTAQRFYGTASRQTQQKAFAPAEILQALEKGLVEDEIPLKFDYTGFQARCRALILATRCTAECRVHDPFQSEEIDDSITARLVHSTLWQAAEVDRHKSRRDIKYGTIPAAFALRVQNFIILDNDSWLSIARNGSSGHLADAEKPCNRWKWGGDNAPEPLKPFQTPLEPHECAAKAKIDDILNSACAQYRSWASQDWTSHERIRKTELWTNKKLRMKGFDAKVSNIELIRDHGTIVIDLEVKRDSMTLQSS